MTALQNSLSLLRDALVPGAVGRKKGHVRSWDPMSPSLPAQQPTRFPRGTSGWSCVVSSTGSRAMQGHTIQSSVQNQEHHHGLHALQTLSLIHSSSPGAGLAGRGQRLSIWFLQVKLGKSFAAFSRVVHRWGLSFQNLMLCNILQHRRHPGFF